MKILVTGANGQVGRELVELGLQQGDDIIAADRSQLDISCQQSVSDFCRRHQPHAIINAAAFTAVDLAEAEPEKAFAVNAQGVKHLANVACELNIPILHISTDYVFDGQAERPYNEQDTPSPINIYGQSKLQGEVYLHNSGARYLILRTSWVFGRYGNNFVKTMLRLASERDELSVIDDQIGCPTAAVDIAKALLVALSALLNNPALVGTYHYAGRSAVSWFELASAAITLAQEKNIISNKPELKAILSEQYPVAAIRPVNSRLDSSKFKRVFGMSGSDWQLALQTIVSGA